MQNLYSPSQKQDALGLISKRLTSGVPAKKSLSKKRKGLKKLVWKNACDCRGCDKS